MFASGSARADTRVHALCRPSTKLGQAQASVPMIRRREEEPERRRGWGERCHGGSRGRWWCWEEAHRDPT